ncbi:hypothetical protein NBRC116494_34310 [Aurantivibrio plasticivorans]
MITKKNLMPEMQKVKMQDRDGNEFSMQLELRKSDSKYFVFLTDTHQLGGSRLAQDAVFFIEKVCQKLCLDNTHTQFYRHIYNEQMGSMFGRFNISWENTDGPSYGFQMLTNLDDVNGINKMLKESQAISLADHVAGRRKVG